jgi:nicotinate phosphoribosyltransferase
MSHDVLALEAEAPSGDNALIVKVMENGRRVFPKESLKACRRRALDGYRSLPPALRNLNRCETYPVEVSHALRTLAAQLDEASRQ